MKSRPIQLLSIIAAIGFWGAVVVPAWAEADDKALAAALKDATATLQGGTEGEPKCPICTCCPIRA